MIAARSIQIRGTVQGVGFRPFIFRLAQKNRVTGWVLNAGQGVDIHIEGDAAELDGFVSGLKSQTPSAARVASIEVHGTSPAGLTDFTIRASSDATRPTVPISVDLPVCATCRREMSDPEDARYRYPYINCTNCGPRYTIVHSLPYDRANTSMHAWPMDDFCANQFEDPSDRRFHAQPVACPECGPHYYFQQGAEIVRQDFASISRAAELLRQGLIVAIKGIGGYHLACDAANAGAVMELRQRKFRREKPFALMVSTLEVAQGILELSPKALQLLTSTARPIVVAPSKVDWPDVAPDNSNLGVMLPYAPIHYLLFEAGAPPVLVMTSANRSNEPIVYRDDAAIQQLSLVADAFLIGERPIARPVDDSIVRVGCYGPSVVRRARGYAPSPVASLPGAQTILALGSDLKNTVTLAVDGEAFMSQHVGDLEQYEAFEGFKTCIADLMSMYEVRWDRVLLAHDLHPGFFSTAHAAGLPASERISIQHHRAHISSVLAERQAWDENVIGIALDGTGYGDDGAIWGGEFFTGSVDENFDRVAHLRYAMLPGGDAAARNPLHCAAGFLDPLHEPKVASLFSDCEPYREASRLLKSGLRAFRTSSMGRLFDAVAAVLGFTRQVSFEGQAAMWLEHQARLSLSDDGYPLPFSNHELDFRPLLCAVVEDRVRGRDIQNIARAFHRSIAMAVGLAALQLCEEHATRIVVLSGGVFQNELLLTDLHQFFASRHVTVWTNQIVPANDGGISLGQAALAAFHTSEAHHA